jgi:hypothetical protein
MALGSAYRWRPMHVHSSVAPSFWRRPRSRLMQPPPPVSMSRPMLPPNVGVPPYKWSHLTTKTLIQLLQPPLHAPTPQPTLPRHHQQWRRPLLPAPPKRRLEPCLRPRQPPAPAPATRQHHTPFTTHDNDLPRWKPSRTTTSPLL